MFKPVLVFISIFLCLSVRWLARTFGGDVSTEQIIFHFFSGLGGTDISLIIRFIMMVVVMSIIITIIWFLINCALKARLFLWPQYIKTIYIFIDTNKAYLFLLLITLMHVSDKIHFLSFLKAIKGEDRFTNYYIDPKKITYLNPITKKNLIIIYFESLEYNLRNSQIHGSNLIKSIDDLKGVNILTFPSAPGTNWSIAGIMASQCAVPLKPLYYNTLNTKDTFLPGLTCLGDILKRYGYIQYFLTGTKLRFAGTDKFFKNHGYDFMYGRNEWRKQGINQKLFTGWGEGVHDDLLLTEAKKIIAKNVALKQPYNLTLFTSDTHPSEGYYSDQCLPQEKTSGFRGAFKCSSRFLADFIKDLEANNLLINTTIIIMGDHPFMANQEQTALFPNPRNVYFKIIDADNKAPTRNSMTHFDVAPTILNLLGLINDQDDHFGLGISLFSTISAKNYKTHLTKVTNKDILNHSSIYDAFWLPKHI